MDRFTLETDKKLISRLTKLIYGEREFVESLQLIEDNFSKWSLEYNLFKSRILADTGRFPNAVVLSNNLIKSQKLDELFYLLDGANDSLILDLVNIGHKLRSNGFTDESKSFFKKVYQAQFDRAMVNRTTVVQRLIDRSREKQYLEIGVFVGHNFLQMVADRKVGVDPVLRIKQPEKFEDYTHFYEVTSDCFFEEKMDPILDNKPDVVFIDGLHTYEQSLQDVLNALEFLKDDGVIVMHDCYPRTEAAAHPEQAVCQKMDSYQGFWNGDVFKAILWLRANRPDLNVFVLDTDHGLGVVTKATPENTLSLTDEQIKRMEYSTFEADYKNLLNLKSPEYFNDWINTR